jgi:hypothetical protein
MRRTISWVTRGFFMGHGPDRDKSVPVDRTVRSVADGFSTGAAVVLEVEGSGDTNGGGAYTDTLGKSVLPRVQTVCAESQVPIFDPVQQN